MEMAPISRQDATGRGACIVWAQGGDKEQDATRRGGTGCTARRCGVKSWGTPTGKSPDYFTDCRRGPRYRERAAAVAVRVSCVVVLLSTWYNNILYDETV